jgi:hypothetical protein
MWESGNLSGYPRLKKAPHPRSATLAMLNNLNNSKYEHFFITKSFLVGRFLTSLFEEQLPSLILVFSRVQ